ncbi:hypothetical protein MP638_005713 [Amoeboaphelidium occidentale]|nr:hypothetical protein MP638_005713 [Amoeboaphelidium occidentale]
MSSSKLCWICFASEAEELEGTSQPKRWVSPCRCSGDTKWAHETCILTWIVRKQSEKASEGEPVPVLIYEHNQPDNLQEILNRQENAAQPEAQQNENILARLGLTVDDAQIELEEHLIKCPQCQTPYRIEIAKRGYILTLLMNSYNVVTVAFDAFVPYGAIISASFFVVSSAATYGWYVVTTLCGPQDLLTLHLKSSNWGLLEVAGLFSIPFYATAFHFGKLSRVLLYAGISTLASNYLVEMSVSMGPLKRSLLSNLVRRRISTICGLFVVRYFYRLLHDRFLAPLIVGVQKKPLQDASSTSDEINFEDYDLLPQQGVQSDRLTAHSAMKSIVYTMFYPGLAAFTGRFLKRAVASSKFSFDFGLYHLDYFQWSLIGGCVFTVVKDMSQLFFNRQRRVQRTKMHVRNYP